MAILAILLAVGLVGSVFALLLDMFVIRPFERYEKSRWYDRFL